MNGVVLEREFPSSAGSKDNQAWKGNTEPHLWHTEQMAFHNLPLDGSFHPLQELFFQNPNKM